MPQSLFRLPDEIILTPVLQSFPCREQQIRALATLLHVRTPNTDCWTRKTPSIEC